MTAFYRLAATALLLGFSAVAQAEPETVEVGKWTVGPEDETSCQAVAPFGDTLTVAFAEDATGEGMVLLRDTGWKLDELEDAPGTISWDGWKNTQDIDFTPIQHADGSWMLMAETGSWFTENLAGSKEIWLKIPAAKVDADFKVDEASDLVTAVATCNENH